MRTTLDIDDDVLSAAKELARQQHSTAGRVISDLARRALTGTGTPEGTAEPAVAYGFRPFRRRGGVVTDDEVERLRDKESI